MFNNEEMQKAVMEMYETSISFEPYEVMIHMGLVPYGKKRQGSNHRSELSRIGSCIYKNGIEKVSGKRYKGKLLVNR